MISIEHVYTEKFKNCDFFVPTFSLIKIILKYNYTTINFNQLHYKLFREQTY